MIYLMSGLPGAGKSLYTIMEVKDRSERENRAVFYSGIAQLKLPWKELDDPQAWHKVPDGAIIVIDECQEVLPIRKQGAEVPDFIKAFSTHRHKGLDIYLITQDPMQFDHFVRRLVQVYTHLVRPYGLQYATVFQFERVVDWSDYHEQKNAIKKRFDYPKEGFELYKSAEVHTHKRRLPWKKLVIVICSVLFVIGAGGATWYYVTRGIGNNAEAKKKEDAKNKGLAGAIGARVPGPNGQGKAGPLTMQQYVEARIPRIAGMPESAPLYDELAKPMSFPHLAGCADMGRRNKGCVCYTQQGTVVAEVSDRLCKVFVARGAFDHYRGGGQLAAGAGQVQPGGGQKGGGDLAGQKGGPVPAGPVVPVTLRDPGRPNHPFVK